MPTDVIKERCADTGPISHLLSQTFMDLSIKDIWNDADIEIYDSSILKPSDSSNANPLDYFVSEAIRKGFVVGQELETVKAKSRRSLMQQMSNHISQNFQNLYGKENSGVRQNYFQIGVRVPSKEHVSEIVGKQGIKIKEIRERTGALIITPGEIEDHVFIIEATPMIALNVAKMIDDRAKEISLNRIREMNPKAFTVHQSYRCLYNKSYNSQISLRPILATGIIEVPKNIVGRIIGTHGSIITTIQKDTGTEIRSPPKDQQYSSTGKAKFEILVYQKTNSIDLIEAQQRIKNAKQLIAHVAMHQMERIRSEESPFSNYRIKNLLIWENCLDNSDSGIFSDKEQLLSYQMQSVAWLWDEVDRLDNAVADEVVLRILEESKKKSKLRSDYSNGDCAIDRHEDGPIIPFQHGSFNQQNSVLSSFDLLQYHPITYNDVQHLYRQTQIVAPFNGRAVENGCCCVDRSFNDTAIITATSSDYLPSNLKTQNGSYKNRLLNGTDPLSNSIRSYADNVKAFKPTKFSNNLSSLKTGNLGAIGDHIKKYTPIKTAQLK